MRTELTIYECDICAAEERIESGGKFPQGWVSHFIGIKRQQFLHFCPEHCFEDWVKREEFRKSTGTQNQTEEQRRAAWARAAGGVK
jgi:hypothetical protein